MLMYKSMCEFGRHHVPYRPVGFIVDAPKDTAIKNAVYTDEDGNPRSDIGPFLSEETAPEVRDYISRMHRERPETENIPEKIKNDDAIIEGMPNHGESLMEYEDRVQKLVDDEKESRKTKKAEQKLKQALKDLGINN